MTTERHWGTRSQRKERVRTERESSPPKAKEKRLSRNQHVGNIDLELPASRTVREYLSVV